MQNRFTFHEIFNKNNDFINGNKEKANNFMKKLRKVNNFEYFIIFMDLKNRIFVWIKFVDKIIF